MGQWSAAFMPLHRSAANDAWSDLAPSTLRELKRHKCRAPWITSKTGFHWAVTSALPIALPSRSGLP